MQEENYVLFKISEYQAELLAKHYNISLKDLEEFEICGLLNKYIYELEKENYNG